jgi:hypothetical protein
VEDGVDALPGCPSGEETARCSCPEITWHGNHVTRKSRDTEITWGEPRMAALRGACHEHAWGTARWVRFTDTLMTWYVYEEDEERGRERERERKRGDMQERIKIGKYYVWV